MDRVRALLAVCVLAAVAACSESVGIPTALLTGSDPRACWAGAEPHVEGRLLVDARYGTSLDGVPVIWPTGYSGIQLTSGEVAVMDHEHKVVATTGKRYRLASAYSPSPELEDLIRSTDGFATSPCFHELDQGAGERQALR